LKGRAAFRPTVRALTSRKNFTGRHPSTSRADVDAAARRLWLEYPHRQLVVGRELPPQRYAVIMERSCERIMTTAG
jgi:hypothetical protein